MPNPGLERGPVHGPGGHRLVAALVGGTIGVARSIAVCAHPVGGAWIGVGVGRYLVRSHPPYLNVCVP